MGMFDYIRCEMPLERDHNSRTFQSKDFDCQLALIVIQADGTLFPPNGGEHSDYTGKFNFYDLRWLKDGKELPYVSGGMEYESEWIEYEATAINGTVNQITLIKNKLEKKI